MNYYADENEWKWLFKNALDWDAILKLYYPSFPTEDGFENETELFHFMEELLTNTGDWCANSIASNAEKLDKMGSGKVVDGAVEDSPILKNLVKEAVELQVLSLAVEKEYGGMGMPAAMAFVFYTQICRACQSSYMKLALHGSIADMVERFCDEGDRERLIPRLTSGEISGAMCLTEPDAGSDVGSMKTTAVPIEGRPGYYHVTGSKMFITNAGGGLHFTLARIKGAPEGLAGISMFLIESDGHGGEGLNYQVVKIEEKMGMHGSATCQVAYENTVSKLLGNENEGFSYMLHLMNEARIATGLQGLGGIESCLHYVKTYAEEREQFGKNLMQLPLYKRNYTDWTTERDAIRAMMMDTLSSFDIYQFLDKKRRRTGDLINREEDLYKKHAKIVRRRTPLTKFYGSEAFTRLSVKSIQALGGYGFVSEYPVERWHRDSFGPLLYEGTSQIQSLMSLKDYMKMITKKPQVFITALVENSPLFQIKSKAGPKKSLVNRKFEFQKNFATLLLKVLSPGLNANNLKDVKKFFSSKAWFTEEAVNKMMIHAETFCEALCYLETLEVLTKHAIKDSSREDLRKRYHRLIKPRLKAIYADWKQNY